MRKGTLLFAGISSSNSPASPTNNGSGAFIFSFFKLLFEFFDGGCGVNILDETGLWLLGEEPIITFKKYFYK